MNEKARMLYLFDIDGTVIRSFLREGADRSMYDEVELLPGRREKITQLRADGAQVALVTNQGGVAMGYQDVGQVCRKIAKVLEELGLPQDPIAHGIRDHRDWEGKPVETRVRPSAYVAFDHPRARLDRYRRDSYWRKPGPGMLLCAVVDYGVLPEDTVYVGDMDTDMRAADLAGLAYEDAQTFFDDRKFVGTDTPIPKLVVSDE